MATQKNSDKFVWKKGDVQIMSEADFKKRMAASKKKTGAKKTNKKG